MTSLSLQLKRLALPQTDPNLFSRNEVASLLFDPKDAATMDRSSFYALGCTGLEQLVGIEPSFSRFHGSLFSSASVTLERSVQTKLANRQLDRDIELFLCRVSPYFLLRPSHKCLEWLIHRFHVHLYNVDALVASVLPFHDTKIFVRVIQLLKIDEPSNKWNWLSFLQKPGVPLSRATLVSRLHKDLSFMDFICDLVLRSVQVFSDCPGAPQLRIIFSFYAATVVSSLDSAPSVTDSMITKLLPHVHQGLRSPLVDFRAGSLMILCQLSVKVVMEKVLVQALSSALIKSLRDRDHGQGQGLVRETLGALIVLLQNQDQAGLTSKSLTRLCSVPGLVSSLEAMAQTHDVFPLLRPLLLHLLRCTFHSSDSASSDSASDLLQKLLTSVPLTPDLALTLARQMLDLFLSQCEDNEEMNSRLCPLIRIFETKFSAEMDSCLSGRVAELREEEKPLFHRLLSLTTTSGKFQILGDSDSSLVLSLNHPRPSVRVLALDQLQSMVSSGQGASVNLDFVTTSVFARLKDDDPRVVTAALRVLQILDSVDPEETLSVLLDLLLRAQTPCSVDWHPVMSSVVHSLSSVSVGRPDADTERLVFKLLPLLVPSGTGASVQLNLVLSLSQSSVLETHPLMAGWRTALESVFKSGPGQGPDQVLVLVHALVSTLVSNLEKMETFSQRHILECLCRCVELLSEANPGPGLGPGRTPLLVLLQTSVLGLKLLSNTHHLLMARRLYMVIQRHLMEDHGPAPAALGNASSFYDWLGLYLHEGEEHGFGLVLVQILSLFIRELKSPDQDFKAEPWWNPERLDSNTCCYLQLLAQVCSVLVGGASDRPMGARYRGLLGQILRVHLKSEPMLILRFLALIWSHASLNGDQTEGRGQPLGVVLQTQALLMGGALLEGYSPETVQSLVQKTPVFPCVLVSLSSPWSDMRRAGLVVLRSLSGSAPFAAVAERLLHTAEEVTADGRYLSSALGVLFSERRQEVDGALEKLLESICSPCCPSDTAASLLGALCHVHGEDVLLALLPALDRLLAQICPDGPPLLQDEARLLVLLLRKFSPEAAPLLVTNCHCRDLFLRAMRTSPVQTTALELISRPFFSALDEEVQQCLLSSMFDVLADRPDPETSQSISSVFKQISLDAQLVAAELSPPEKATSSASVQQTRRAKVLQSRRTMDRGNPPPEEGTVSWRRVTLILELLQRKKKLKRPQALVPPLFTLLQRRLEPHGEDPASVENTKQLLLSCLLSVFNKLSPEGATIPPDVLDPQRLSVELVVHCIRSSEMSQTHHQGLLLLSCMAPLYPEKVLMNIVPIFTFIGANVLRLDDAYSLKVIDKTVQMVIPALLQGGTTAQVSAGVTRVVQVFVDALPHVPDHRRVPVLTRLLGTIGEERVLWVLLLLLCKQQSTAASPADQEPGLDLDWSVWISVCGQFSVKVQIQAVIQILVFLQQLRSNDTEPAGERRSLRRRVVKEEKIEDLIFDPDDHSSKELRHFRFICVSFCGYLLGSSSFARQMVQQEVQQEVQNEGAGGADQSLQQLEQKLLEQVLKFIHSVAQFVEQISENPKYWRVLLNKSYELLDKVTALLPSDWLVSVTRGLMGNEVSNIRRKSLELFNNKLQQKRTWSQDQASSLLLLLPDLLSVVNSSSEVPLVRQTALFSLKLLCGLFGSEPQPFVAVMKVAVAVVMETGTEPNIVATALQCITENIRALRALAIPHLPSLVPALLDVLDRGSCVSEMFLLSSVSALHCLCDTLANFTSPYLLDITTQVCRLSRLVEGSSPSPALVSRLQSLRSTVASRIPSRVLLPTVCKCYSRLVPEHKDRLVALMSLLQEHIDHMDRDQVTLHQSELTAFFLTALDFRAAHCQVDLDEAEKVEGSVIRCLLSMILKLSEVTFRPLFFKLFDWCKESKLRLLTFVGVADAVAQKLKSLFVLFAGNLVKTFADVLRHREQLDPWFSSEQTSCLLLRLVLNCLHKIFLYDSQKFLSSERATALLGPLVDQLEDLGGPEQRRLRLTQALVPCLGQFAAALADTALQKNLNLQVALKTRHPDPQVRVSSLLVLVEICSKLKENYLVLLPETIPFLAELMEDENEEVEKEVQRVVQEMENVLGEPLQSFF